MFPPESRILVVDDMQSIRELLGAYLRRLGYNKITEASDGREAYKSLMTAKSQGFPYHLIICDWNMPNLDGLDFLKLVRANSETANLPFLIITNENEKHKVVEAIQFGVTNYMVKPLEEATLKEKLERTWEKIKP